MRPARRRARHKDSSISPTATATPAAAGSEPASRNRLGEWGWALVEWGRTPHVLLVTVYIFHPYFATSVAPDPATGQAYLGYAEGLAGIVIALSAPFLGAIGDQWGRRKPPVTAAILLMGLTSCALWYGLPNHMQGGLPVWAIAFLIGVMAVLFVFSEVFHNSMLPGITPRAMVGYVSGLGLALGNLGGLLLLIALLALVSLPGSEAAALFGGLLPDAPLWGLDPAQGEDSRVVGPIAGVWMMIFVVPLLLWTPDGTPSKESLRSMAMRGLAQVVDSLRHIRHHRNVATYLIARMMYNDGKVVILTFGGVVAAGIFGWGVLQLLIYGIVLSVFAVLGGFLAGPLEKWMGTKNTLVLAILATSTATVLLLSMGPDRLFFLPYSGEWRAWELNIMNTLPEVVFVACALPLAVFITVAYASSRSMMAQLAPPEKVSEFFGLYAISGTATAFVGHLMVGVLTDITDSQRWGFASSLMLLVPGLLLLFLVREPQKS